MKPPILVLPVVLLTAQLALAQQAPPAPPPHGGGPRVEMMARQLGLDETQKAQVKRILEEQRAAHDAERKQYEATGQRPTPEERRAMSQQHDQELIQALSGVLTPEQLSKFKTMQAGRREHMRRGPPPAPPAPPAGQ